MKEKVTKSQETPAHKETPIIFILNKREQKRGAKQDFTDQTAAVGKFQGTEGDSCSMMLRSPSTNLL